MQTGAATVENNMEFPQRIKNGTAFCPSNPTSWNTSQDSRNAYSKENMHPYAHSSIIYDSQALETAQVPNSR